METGAGGEGSSNPVTPAPRETRLSTGGSSLEDDDFSVSSIESDSALQRAGSNASRSVVVRFEKLCYFDMICTNQLVIML